MSILHATMTHDGQLSDEVLFNDEMEKMYRRLNRWAKSVPTCLEDIVADRAEKDADRILKGETTYHVMAPFRNQMKASGDNPDSSYYGAGYKFYRLYCRNVQKHVSASRPERRLQFPEW